MCEKSEVSRQRATNGNTRMEYNTTVLVALRIGRIRNSFNRNLNNGEVGVLEVGEGLRNRRKVLQCVTILMALARVGI